MTGELGKEVLDALLETLPVGCLEVTQDITDIKKIEGEKAPIKFYPFIFSRRIAGQIFFTPSIVPIFSERI